MMDEHALRVGCRIVSSWDVHFCIVITDMVKNCSGEFPFSSTIFQNISSAEKYLVIVCSLIVFGILGLLIEEIWMLCTRYPNQKERWRILWLLGIYPVFSLTSLLSLLVPRATVANDFLATLYLSVAIYCFLKLMIAYHLGETNMRRMNENVVIPLRSPPLGCCLCCCKLPEVKVTKRSFLVIKALVLQVSFIRPIMRYSIVITMLDANSLINKHFPKTASRFVSVVSTVSMMVAMYGLLMTLKISQANLTQQKLRIKFILLQLTLLVSILQLSIFNFLASFDLPACQPPLSSLITGNRYHHMLLILEMLLLSLFARWVYQPVDIHHEIQLGEERSSPINDTDNC